jgi:hypothetical protein
VHQCALNRSDRQIGQQSQRCRGFIEFPKLSELADHSFGKLTLFVQVLNMCPGSLETGRIFAQFRLNLVGGLFDHLADQFCLPAIRSLKFEPHRFRSSFEQSQ